MSSVGEIDRGQLCKTDRTGQGCYWGMRCRWRTDERDYGVMTLTVM